MKKFAIALFAATMLLFSTVAYSVPAKGWRLVLEQSIANNTPMVISEIEFLYDDDPSPLVENLVDATEGDLGIVACGWTRDVANNPGGTPQVGVATPCDSVATDQTPDISVVPSGTRRTRLGKLMFDNSFASRFLTVRTLGRNDETWTVQYTFYIGATPAGTDPNRITKDVVAYTVTVPNNFTGPTVNGYAPSIWRVEYLDSASGQWINYEDAEVFAANFNDGYDVDPTGLRENDTGYTASVGKQLFFRLP